MATIAQNDITIHLEPFQAPSLKEQAIAHWEENLKRVKAMNWRAWRACSRSLRSTVVLFKIACDNYPFIGGEACDNYPFIGGEACPYCTRYRRACWTVDGHEQCPLKQGDVPGGCCVAWLNVREALLTPWNKVQTVMAVKAMIEYIKEARDE